LSTFVAPLAAASLLLAGAPASADVEREMHVEESVETDEDLDERRTERSVEVEREGALGTRTESYESTREESIDDGDVEVEKRTEKRTTIDD
jgi:hypothetical protein